MAMMPMEFDEAPSAFTSFTPSIATGGTGTITSNSGYIKCGHIVFLYIDMDLHLTTTTAEGLWLTLPYPCSCISYGSVIYASNTTIFPKGQVWLGVSYGKPNNFRFGKDGSTMRGTDIGTTTLHITGSIIYSTTS